MKKKTILLLVFGLTLSCFAVAQNVITEANVLFKIRNLGFNVEGKFSKSSIETDFSNKDYSKWKIKASVDVASINTDNESRDNHLLKNDFFDVKNHPKLSLRTIAFDKTGDNLYSVEVELTIKNVTRTLKIPCRILKTKTSEEFYSYFEIKRKDFNVGGSSLVLSNTVKIRVEYNLKTD